MRNQMRLAFAIQALLWPILFSDSVIAQLQYKNWEEVCRSIGQSTGACAPKSELEKPIGCVQLGGKAFHAEKFTGGCLPTTLAPGGDAQIFVEMIGLPNLAKVTELKLTIGRSVGFNNAVALFNSGSRMIIHDPEWTKSANAEFYLVIGHEAGHHFCGHTLSTFQGSPQEAELEADRFSGASIKRFEVWHGKAFLNDALKAAARLYSASGSRSHPPRPARIEAISLGYTSGSPCGNLAPAIRGASPQPR
jgi:hypothetical protein